MPAPAFGSSVPCRNCHGSGKVRGSGLDARGKLDYRMTHGEKAELPTEHPCGDCEGAGYVAPGADLATPTRLAKRVAREEAERRRIMRGG